MVNEKKGHHRRRSRTLAGIMVALACVLAPVAVTSVWADRIISDTDQYVETVAPLARNAGVQTVVTDEVTRAVLDDGRVQDLVRQALAAVARQRPASPAVAGALPGLEGALVSGIDSYVRGQVARFVASDRFASLWDQANRTAHAQVVHLLSGTGRDLVEIRGDTVTLDLAPIIAQVRSALAGKGFTLTSSGPPVNRSFVLMRSSSLTRAQSAFRAVDALGTWSPAVTVVLLVGGVLLARDRRRTLLRGSLGLAGAMVALGVILALMRTWYVDTTPGDVLPSTTAGQVFDALVRFLRTSLRAVGVLALVLAFAAWLGGPTPAALRTRRSVVRPLGSLRGSADAAGGQSGRAGAWIDVHRAALRLAVAGLAGTVLVFWHQPTAWLVVAIALIVGLLLAAIEFLARPPHPRP